MLFENEKPAKNKPVLDDVRIDDEIYEVVDWFYPRRGFVQVLQLYMSTNDIMNIMNCNYEDALTLYYKIRDYYGDRSMRILIPHFCHYTGIDELWAHLFITSLKKRILLPSSLTSDELSDDDPFAGEERIKLAQAIENMKHGKMDSLATRRERARQWKLLNTKGERHAKRFDNFRVVIYSDEVAGLLRIHLRTAQAMLKEIRTEYEIPRIAPISIRRFGFHFKYQEEELRMGLACMYGEEYIAP